MGEFKQSTARLPVQSLSSSPRKSKISPNVSYRQDHLVTLALTSHRPQPLTCTGVSLPSDSADDSTVFFDLDREDRLPTPRAASNSTTSSVVSRDVFETERLSRLGQRSRRLTRSAHSDMPIRQPRPNVGAVDLVPLPFHPLTCDPPKRT